MIDFNEIDGLFISRSSVEVGAKVTGKGLQFIETVLLLEDFGIQRNRRVCAVATGTSAEDSFVSTVCGAESVPMKNFGLPEIAARLSASLC